MMVVVLNSLLTERVEEQEKSTQTGLQCTHQQSCVVAAVTAPTAPGCVEINAVGHFSCLCCDAVKGILGNMREKSAKVISRADLVKWEDRGRSSRHPGIWFLLGQMRT